MPMTGRLMQLQLMTQHTVLVKAFSNSFKSRACELGMTSSSCKKLVAVQLNRHSGLAASFMHLCPDLDLIVND